MQNTINAVCSQYRKAVKDGKTRGIVTYKLPLPMLDIKGVSGALKDIAVQLKINPDNVTAVCDQILGRTGKATLLARAIRVKVSK